MDIWVRLLQIMDSEMNTPTPYGWFHLLWLGLTIAASIVLCIYGRQASGKQIRGVIFAVAVVVALLEVYKQINYTFGDGSGTPAFQWYAFPFQFCSTPMYAGLLTGIFRKGKVHDALMAYLATYSVFAGICVMVYPVQVFISTIGINVQTMFCHGTMIPIGLWLLASGYVKLEHKTIWGAIAVFACAIGIAMVLNEVAYYSGLLENHTFNMFFISPHCDPSLPVYSLVQQVLPFPFCLVVYIAAFSAAAYLILLSAIGVKHFVTHRAKKPTCV